MLVSSKVEELKEKRNDQTVTATRQSKQQTAGYRKKKLFGESDAKVPMLNRRGI